ncbi:hypothetical protein ACN4EE_22360 [Geminocystis sp. CENA526]
MTLTQNQDQNIKNKESSQIANCPVLCDYCKRTATNGIKCKGMCVADSDY